MLYLEKAGMGNLSLEISPDESQNHSTDGAGGTSGPSAPPLPQQSHLKQGGFGRSELQT